MEQFFPGLLRMVEERFGRRSATALLFIVILAVLAFSAKLFWDKAVWSGVEAVRNVQSAGWADRIPWPEIGIGVGLWVMAGLSLLYLYAMLKPRLVDHAKNSRSTAAEACEEGALDWLGKAIERDRSQFAQRIFLEVESFDGFKGIGLPEPFIDAIVRVTNATMCPIVIEAVEGSFAVSGNSPCTTLAQVEGRTRVLQGAQANIRIHQPITDRTSDLVAVAGNGAKKVGIDLRPCRLVIRREEPNLEDATVTKNINWFKDVKPLVGS